jgi:hypothetical protein
VSFDDFTKRASFSFFFNHQNFEPLKIKWHSHDTILFQVIFSTIIIDKIFHSYKSSFSSSDPAIAPTKPIQNVVAADHSQWQHQPKSRFDTTYRAEFINRFRNPVYYHRYIFSVYSLFIFFC